MQRGCCHRGCEARTGARCHSGEFELTPSLSLLAPGLAARFPAVAEDVFPAAPALSKWLARGAARPFEGLRVEQAALALFGVDTPGAATPVAPFMMLADTGTASSGCWWCVDPVHLRADSRGLILFDAESCKLDEPERQALFLTLDELVSARGWTLRAGEAGRWYLRGPECGRLDTAPLSQVCGRPVGDYLPHGDAAAQWMQCGNEMQMLLHSHPVNQARTAKGLPAVNSTWIWGGGALPEPGRRVFDAVYSSDPLVRGLALWSGASVQRPPAVAGDLLQNCRDGGRILLMPDSDLACAAAYEKVSEWCRAVLRYEHDWFAPLLRALSAGRLQSLELIALNRVAYRLRRRDLWRFWSRAGDWRQSLDAAS